jgi:hypothetical protein
LPEVPCRGCNPTFAGDRRRRARQAVGEVQRLHELRIPVADPAYGAAVPVEHGTAGVLRVDGEAARSVDERQEGGGEQGRVAVGEDAEGLVAVVWALPETIKAVALVAQGEDAPEAAGHRLAGGHGLVVLGKQVEVGGVEGVGGGRILVIGHWTLLLCLVRSGRARYSLGPSCLGGCRRLAGSRGSPSGGAAELKRPPRLSASRMSR